MSRSYLDETLKNLLKGGNTERFAPALQTFFATRVLMIPTLNKEYSVLEALQLLATEGLRSDIRNDIHIQGLMLYEVEEIRYILVREDSSLLTSFGFDSFKLFKTSLTSFGAKSFSLVYNQRLTQFLGIPYAAFVPSH